MISRVFSSVVLSFAMAFFAGPVWACSLTSDFFGLSNFELVEKADAIAIATAESFEQGERRNAVVFRVTEMLKGAPAETVKNSYGYAKRRLPKTPENTLNTLHPSAMEGSCSRSAFEKGEPYIVMISRDEDGQRVMRYPFERNASDYHGPASLWRRAVEYYIDVQTDPDRMLQLDRLRADRETLAASENPMDQLLAYDIADHLTSVSPLMPTQHLIGLYDALQKGPLEVPTLQVPTGNPEFEANPELALIADLFGQTPDQTWDRNAMARRVMLAVSQGEHPDALPFMTAKADAPNAPPIFQAYVIQMLANAEDWDAMIARVDPSVFEIMSTGSKGAAAEIMSRVGSAMQPWSDTPEWKKTEQLRDWYPNFALRYARANMRHGEETGLPRGVKDIVRPEDYRADPELTLILANDFDKPVRAWAHEETMRLLQSEETAFSKAFVLPLQVLLLDYKFDESDSFTEIFCNVNKGRPALIRATALMEGAFYRDDILERLAASDMDEKD